MFQLNNDSVAKAINLLTRVSGIGPAKAKELVDHGVRTIADLEKHKDKLTHQQLIGLQYFKDFEIKIPREEVEDIEKIIRRQIAQLDDAYLSRFGFPFFNILKNHFLFISFFFSNNLW